MTVRQPPIGHMPFDGHRTCKQVREDAERALKGMADNIRPTCWNCVSRSVCPRHMACPRAQGIAA